MIRDVKLGFSIIKYAHGYDDLIAIFLFAIGGSALTWFLEPIATLPALFIGVGVIGLVQNVYVTSISTMVQTSPYKKKLRTTIPTYFALISLLAANTMSIGIHWITYLRIKDNTDPVFEIIYDPKTYASSIVVSIVILMIILIYVVMSNVFLFVSSLVFVSIVIRRIFLADKIMDLLVWEISTEAAVVLSYVVVFAGSGILYLLNCLLYKFQYSELSTRSIIKRAIR